jgi:hypothetical protein
MRDDESLAIAEPRGHPAQVLKDRFTQEWNIAGAVRVASLNPTNPEASPGVRGAPRSGISILLRLCSLQLSQAWGVLAGGRDPLSARENKPLDNDADPSQFGLVSFVWVHRQFTQRLASTSRQRP